ncbi:MAG: halocyanin domain-containing protein [Halapricum sp.]
MEDYTATRRTVLRASAAATAAGGLSAVATAAPPFDGWLENTSNFDGLIDRTGQSEVTVSVGVSGNGGPNGFGPPAIRVDPGTTVVWEWTGDGYHNVEAEDGAFRSESTDSAGYTFEQIFEEEGVVKYLCRPHEPMGMKGAVVVGDAEVAIDDVAAGEDRFGGADYGDWFDDVGNFEGTVDRTGQERVTVKVGSEGNNGVLAFDPPAVRVDPGTTVVWEWTGVGGAHNVVAEDGRFESELTGDADHTFERAVESGLIKYYCLPHKEMGMKGAVVVDGTSSGGLTAPGALLSIGGGLGLTAGLFGLFGTAIRERSIGYDE